MSCEESHHIIYGNIWLLNGATAQFWNEALWFFRGLDKEPETPHWPFTHDVNFEFFLSFLMVLFFHSFHRGELVLSLLVFSMNWISILAVHLFTHSKNHYELATFWHWWQSSEQENQVLLPWSFAERQGNK